MNPQISERGRNDARLPDPQADAPRRRGEAARASRSTTSTSASPTSRRPRRCAHGSRRRPRSSPTRPPAARRSTSSRCATTTEAGDRPRRRPDHRHHRRQRGDPLRAAWPARRGRRGARRRAVLHELQRLRDDGGRAPRARCARAARTASTCRPRGVGARPHAAHAARPALQPEQPDRHRLHAATSSRRWPPSAATTASSWSPTRSTASSSTTARTATSALTLPGVEDHDRRGRQPLEALQRLRHPPGLPRDPQPRRLRAGAAHGAGAALAPRPRPARRPRRDRRSARTTSQGSSREYQSRRDVLFDGPLADPGRLPPQARGRVLLRRAPARRRRRGLRLVAAHRLRARGRDRDGGPGRRASTPPPGWARTRCASPTCSTRRDLEASVRILGHAIPTYQGVQAARLAGARTKH